MDALQVVTAPRRREILGLVRDHELPAGAIAVRLGLTASATSQHLAKLREVGVLIERRAGRQRFYRTDTQRLDAISRGLSGMWGGDLDRLAALAEAAAQGEQQ